MFAAPDVGTGVVEGVLVEGDVPDDAAELLRGLVVPDGVAVLFVPQAVSPIATTPTTMRRTRTARA